MMFGHNCWKDVRDNVFGVARSKADKCEYVNDVYINIRNTVRDTVWANVGSHVYYDTVDNFAFKSLHDDSQLEAAYAALERI
jgi:hypothetical protein